MLLVLLVVQAELDSQEEAKHEKKRKDEVERTKALEDKRLLLENESWNENSEDSDDSDDSDDSEEPEDLAPPKPKKCKTGGASDRVAVRPDKGERPADTTACGGSINRRHTQAWIDESPEYTARQSNAIYQRELANIDNTWDTEPNQDNRTTGAAAVPAVPVSASVVRDYKGHLVVVQRLRQVS